MDRCTPAARRPLYGASAVNAISLWMYRMRNLPKKPTGAIHSVNTLSPAGSEQQDALSCLAIRFCPIPFTALVSPPDHLSCNLADFGTVSKHAEQFSVLVRNANNKTVLEIDATVNHGSITVPLSSIDFEDCAPYSWRVTEITERGSMPNPRWINGIFWLLSPAECEQVCASVVTLTQKSDEVFLTAAKALLLANHALYHDALSLVTANVNADNHKVEVFTHTVRSVIFRQMLHHAKTHFPAEKHLLTWISAHEEKHKLLAQEGVKTARYK